MTQGVAPGEVSTVALTVRRHVRVRGVVQGVGFRPFVYTLATSLGLTGEVGNDAEGVFAQVQGPSQDVEAFCRLLVERAPPLAVVQSLTWRPEPVRHGVPAGFAIVTSSSDSPSSGSSTRRTLVPPDVATCDDCLAELSDPTDRRYRHPFITCTNCGPRFTIVTGLPYDRPMTTMARFPMCAACAAQYADPADRRFHAQPIACHACGPTLELVVDHDGDGDPDEAAEAAEAAQADEGRRTGADALARARELLAQGGIVAVKGVGGYHLAVDATNSVAVQRLRERKQRGDKPFAVLVRDLEVARRLAVVDQVGAGLLGSPRRPVVLLRRRTGTPIAAAVAPRSAHLGVMLPPSALHHLLLGIGDDPAGPLALVLTSGNLSSEPIVTDDAEALVRLRGVADAWLRHDRAIHVPCDDSVMTVVDGEALAIRRSRGYAPMPLPLPVDVEPSLSVGGDLKNTFCVASGRSAWLSGHIGDMDDLATQTAYERAVDQLQTLVEVAPRRLVADRHPGYRSARWAQRAARDRGLDAPVRVQHHHAHIAAVMAENGLDGRTPVLGVAFDGTGYGDDGAVWGGELLLAGYDGYERLAHLAYVPLPGGDAAVHRPYRMALSHLRAAGVDWDERLPAVAACPDDERRVLAHQLETGLACVPTSSAGRLFDAVSSIAGICHVAGYEAQAAMELQAVAEIEAGSPRRTDPGSYRLPLVPPADGSGPWTWDCGALVREVAQDVLDGAATGRVAVRFHRALATAIADGVDAVSPGQARPLARVALSGGVFANGLLLGLALEALRGRGYEVLRHRGVPPNDGGLALGQAVIGARSGSTLSNRVH